MKNRIGLCRLICLMLSFLLCLLSLTACDDSKEQQSINAATIEQAKTNAIAYIEKKYGFTAEVNDAILEREYQIYTSEPLSTVLVYMNYNGKSFHTYINGNGKADNGADDYQYEEILASLTECFRKKIDSVCGVELKSGYWRSVSFDDIEKDCKYLFSTFFDGENLADVINEGASDVIVKCIDADLSTLSSKKFKDIIISKSIYCYFISFCSAEAYQKCNGDKIIDAEHFNYEANVAYIKSYCRMTNAITKFDF